MVNRILKIVIVVVFCLISWGCSNNKNKDTIINDIISYNLIKELEAVKPKN